jgi:hypothetical protein
MRKFLAFIFLYIMVIVGCVATFFTIMKTNNVYWGIVPAIVFSAIAIFGFFAIRERKEK